MKKIILVVILLGIGGYYGYQYWQNKQKAQQEAGQKAEEEAKRKAEEEAKRKAEEEAKRRAEEEEARRRAEEEEARRRAEEARKAAWLLAEKYSGEEKIRIVSEIVKAKISESRENNAAADSGDQNPFFNRVQNSEDQSEGKEEKKDALLSQILEAVYDVMPLDVNKSLQLSPEAIEQLKEHVQNEYPATDKDLKKRYRAEAEEKFPVYQIGEDVTVSYRIYGGSYDKVSGKLYRMDSDHVWIGTKKISRASLSEDCAPRFDPVVAERARKKFVEQSIENYHQERAVFQKTLADDAIHELRGYVKYRGKWLSVRKLVMRKYQEIKEEENRKTADSSGIPQSTTVRADRSKRNETEQVKSELFHNGPVTRF